MKANAEDMRDLDSALKQAERLLKHAQGHLRDARGIADDPMYQLGLGSEDRGQLKQLMKVLDMTVDLLLDLGEQTRPILDKAEVEE